ncbi:MAG TPA: alcohol dehydrogenase catalytic domain-containing protein [Intrasporangium sp.]|uniref:zinc-dependent alcohol dehydrogenase n=1 Tax=Intrasporangium sp. TaxID=1925024 RepID=UPI002D76CB00|nr:alcohol dehydrogenase catalytic domain-containing protein [Intrasporangium sp.]HET7399085.1 alcohol dehydrogenase catalytic domain-containing protein [Intrasporangium sp.]
MRALVLHAAGDARIEERPEPAEPGAGEVRLAVTRAGLCGTDASEYAAGPVMTPLKNRHPASGVLGPVVLGHEFIGVVESVGDGVDRFAVGDRVAAGAGVWCGQCDWCRRGQTNLCRSYWTYGLSADGGLTQRVTVPQAMLHPIAPHVSEDNAALAQPLAVGLHAVDRSRVRPGDVVVVHGAGAIGSFIIAGLKAAGAGSIVAVDVDEARLATARKLGADVTVNAGEVDPLDVVQEHTGSALADVTIEASGVVDGLSRVQRLTRRGGTVLLVGLPKGEVSFRALDLILREIDVMTTLAHVCDTNLPAALDLLAARDLAPLLVERVVPLDRVVEDALTPMVTGTARGKFLVDTQAGAS